jgi:outer membrane protein assembly factor BamB
MKTKSIYTLLIAMALSLGSWAQDDMNTVWEIGLDHQANLVGTGLEGEISYAASDKEMTVFNNDDGSILWSKAYKDIAPKLRKVDELIPFWESDCIFLFDRKIGKDQIAVIDMKTGEPLWTTDQYQNVSEETVYYVPEKDAFAIVMTKGLVKTSSLVFIKAKTGEEVWETERLTGVVGAAIQGDDGKFVLFNMAPNGLQFILGGFKNQVAKMDFDSGDMIWEAPYSGMIGKKVITKEMLGSIRLEEGKVFLMAYGIQAYDYKTGSQLWSASYSSTPSILKAPKNAIKFGVYGGVADPLIIGRDVYVLEMSDKKNQKVKKYDINSGRLLWTSPEIDGAKAIPNMYAVDGAVVLQIGGTVEVQQRVRVKESDGSFSYQTSVFYTNVKPTGVQGFDAETGSALWSSERFKKGITNMMGSEGNVIVCSGKALYKLDAKTGAEQYEVDIKGDGVGLADMIMPYKDQIIIVSAKGLSSHNVSDGKLKGAAKYKKSYIMDEVDNKLIMKTDKDDIACYNLDTVTFKQYNNKNGAQTSLSKDSKYAYVYVKKKVIKLSTD